VRTDTTRHGFEGYLPLPRDERKGIALCLSGGGYRAALFHLGSLRRLNELGILRRVDTITSVSGGSIFAAVVAKAVAGRDGSWPAPGDEWEEAIARPTRKVASTDVRTTTVLSRLKPRNWLRPKTAIDALARRYAEGPAPGLLADLPERPRFVFCATDAQFRTGWVFDTGRRLVGGDAAGYGPPGNWPLSRAVAASSCVPGVFPALSAGADPKALRDGVYDLGDRDELVRTLELCDGGIYDNLGVEPVWRDHEVVLVSSAAPSFTPRPAAIGRLWPSLRYAVTLLEQSTDVRKRWLIASFIREDLDGTYWGIDSLPRNYEHTGEAYDERLIRDRISQVRIDLDIFSEGEIAVLENHGYLMAEIAVQRHAGGLVADGAPPARPPHPEWMDPERAADALVESAQTKLFSRSGLLW
jgi:NTE family protein